MQVFQGNTLGAEIPAAEYVSRMSANAFDPAIRYGDFKATTSFTERANAVVDSFLSWFDHRGSLLKQRSDATPV
jgi:hypothetical protein